MRIVSLILGLILFTDSISGAFAYEENFLEKIKNYESMVEKLLQICTDPRTGRFMDHAIIKDPAGDIDCDEQAESLKQHYLKLSEEHKVLTEEESALACDADQTPHYPEYLQLLNHLTGPEDKKCPEGKESTAECISSMACNAFASFIPGGLVGSQGLYELASKYYQKNGKDIKKSSAHKVLSRCGDFGNSCMANLLKGVWDSIFTTVDGIWELGKLAGKGVIWASKKVANSAVDGYNYIEKSVWSWWNDVEDSTSEKMMAAQQVDDGMLKQFMQDPLAFISTIVGSMYEEMQNAIKNHYGCELWSGAPFISQCVIPMQNWDCGTCNQKMNVMCGVGGFAAGEVVTAFLTGGALAGAKLGAKAAIKTSTEITSKMSILLSKYPKTNQVLSTSATAIKETAITSVKPLTGSLKLIHRAWDALTKSKGLKKLQAAAKRVKGNKVYKYVVASVAVRAGVKGARITTYPVREYINLVGKAFEQGFQQTTNSLTRHQIANAKVLSSTVRKDKEILEEFFKNNGIPEDKHAFYKIKTNMNGAKYIEEDITKLKSTELSLPNRLENDSGALDALEEARRLTKTPINSADDADKFIKESMQKIHEKWLARNTWAQGDPNYPKDWIDLSPELKQANLDMFKIVIGRNFSDKGIKSNMLIQEAIHKIDIKPSQVLAKDGERPTNELLLKLNSDEEISAVADEMHALWQKNTTHKERFKPVMQVDEKFDDASLVEFLSKRNVPKELRRYYRVTLNKNNKRFLEEDIKHLPNRLLSKINSEENINGAKAALAEVQRLLTIKVSNNEEATREIKKALEGIHKSWLTRNTWAAKDPKYSPDWKNLSPEMQLADLDPLKIATVRNFSSSNDPKLKLYLNSINELESKIMAGIKLVANEMTLANLISDQKINRELDIIVSADKNLMKSFMDNPSFSKELLQDSSAQLDLLKLLKNKNPADKEAFIELMGIIQKNMPSSEKDIWLKKIKDALKNRCSL